MTGGPGRGLVIAAPASGSGKTTLTLGLLAALRRRGVAVAGAKVGPDYIDPAFHGAATGRPCANLDGWAMRPGRLDAEIAALGAAADLVLAEGVMGLFDGAPAAGAADDGSTAALAARTGWPVVLVVDARGMAGSAAALVRGFAGHRPGVRLAGVVFNRTGGAGHGAILRTAMADALPQVAVLGCLPRDASLSLPDRHLGLVQAAEHPDLAAFLARAADLVEAQLDLDALAGLALPAAQGGVRGPCAAPLPAPGRHVAIARDTAFAFAYPAVLDGWRGEGAALSFFSPLADEPPDAGADAVYLPGGYPELHAEGLAASRRFLPGLRAAAGRGAAILGECGGYMVLGEGLTDAAGRRHAMAGLLPVETSFAQPRLHLGYRLVRTDGAGPLGAAGTGYRGHEFHYAALLREGPGEPLFHAEDAAGRSLGGLGRRRGAVGGSFVHLIDRI